MTVFYQAGLFIGMLQGVYEGDVDFKTLAKHGDFGLGTFDGVDGELVAVNGKFFRIDADGVATIIAPEKKTPFAVVSKFQKTTAFTIENINSLADLSKVLDNHISTPNIFYMLRIDAELEWIKLRSESCQTPPYRPLADTLPQLQRSFELAHSSGILVISRCPAYSAAFTIPNYHYHYITNDETTGGHVFDLKLKTGKVMINAIREFNMILMNNETFDKADLKIDIQAAIAKIE